MAWIIETGDCLQLLPGEPSNSFDACVTDPPYELGFMGKKWDASGVAFRRETWTAILRVLKPGAHLLAFSGTRTSHRMVCAIEDAGFEIRDSIAWMYGTGFPKSLNLPEGRGTALKPAFEPVCVARKPLEGTVAQNVERWGTGCLNIDGCRIEGEKGVPASPRRAEQHAAYGDLSKDPGTGSGWDPHTGRWPANVVLDEEAAAQLDQQSGILKSGAHSADEVRHTSKTKNAYGERAANPIGDRAADSGGASRFFYCAKASRAERERGCEGLPAKQGHEAVDREEGSAGVQNPRAGAGRTAKEVRNFHPTVKPVSLMRWLVRLVTPPSGVVLDPFAGSGTTGIAACLEGRQFIGIEMLEEHAAIARARISVWESYR